MRSLIEAILGKPKEFPQTRDPLVAFLDAVNNSLEQNFGKGHFDHPERKILSLRLRTPSCEVLDETTRNTLAKRAIVSPFWERLLVFSSHEECFLPDRLGFVYDKDKGLFVLSLKNVLENAEGVQIVCQDLEELFNKRFVQARFAVQRGAKRSTPTEKMFLGIDQIRKQERILFVIARYHEGFPQITLSVLNLDSNWRELFDDNGKLKAAAPSLSRSAREEKLEPPRLVSPRQDELSVLLPSINEALRKKGVIKTNERVSPNSIFLPQITYEPDVPQIPIFIVAAQEEINPTPAVSINRLVHTGNASASGIEIVLNGLFVRCAKERITAHCTPEENSAILLILNRKAYMQTLTGGFYRKEKGIIAIPFELPNDQNSQTSPL